MPSAIAPLMTKNRHQAWVTRRVYRTAACGSAGSRRRASRSIREGPDTREAPNAASMAALTSTGYSLSGSTAFDATATATSSSAPAALQRAAWFSLSVGRRVAAVSNSSAASQRGSMRSWPSQIASG